MSKNTNNSSNKQTEHDEKPRVAAQSNVETPFPGSAKSPAKDESPAPSRILVRFLVFVFTLAVLAAGAYYAWDKFYVTETAEEDSVLDSLTETIRSQDELIAMLRNRLQELESQQNSLRGDLSRSAGDLDELKQRLGDTERSMSALRGISDSSRNTLLIAEARYFLELAGRRLDLEKDPKSATAALEAAGQRLSATDDDAYNPVLAMIQQEVNALAEVHTPDIAGLTSTLDDLAYAVDDMPLRGNVPDDDEAVRAALEEESSLDRAMTAVGTAFKDMFRVRRTDEKVMPLLAPEEEYFLRQNLKLKLETARLAALRNDSSNYVASVAAAADWIDNYFEPGDAGVTRAQFELEQLSAYELEPETPDISGSLRLLRRIAFSGADGP